MRIGYTDEEDYPGQFELWQANCERSLHGRAGQQALCDLEAELLSMPNNAKRLIRDDLALDGQVCAVGALMRRRGVAQSRLEEINETDDTDALAVKEAHVPKLVAWKIVEMNDLWWDTVSPEQRYENVLAWVREHIIVAA